MKDHILHLDPNDDFASARDKIGWAQAERVVLVWPRRGRPLDKKLDLILLHRHADRLGTKLGFVTSDSEIGDLADELGIPVFGSIEASHLERWKYFRPAPLPDRSTIPPDVTPALQDETPLFEWPNWVYGLLEHERAAQITLFIVAIAALIALAIVVVPSATVTLVPASQPISLPVTIVADPAQAEADTATGTIPARVIEVKVQTSAGGPTSGLQDQPSAKARGFVIFTNRHAGALSIPKGTAVRTTGGTTIRFVTTKEVTTPAESGGAVSVPIEAVDAGPSSNVGAGQINSVEGTLSGLLVVVNPEPTSGGAVQTVAAVTEKDQYDLRQLAMTQIEAKALAALGGQLGASEFLAPDSLRLIGTPLETFNHFVGEKADSLTLDLRATFAATAVNERGAQTVARSALEEMVGGGLGLIPGSETFERETKTTSDEQGRVTFSIRAAGRVAPTIDVGEVREAVRGQSISTARGNLSEQYELAVPPKIEVWPKWMGRVPWLAMRIEVQVRQSGN